MRRKRRKQREHAILSASGAHRWPYCTPSARLEEKYPDTQSPSASEGTFAHALAEMRLRMDLGQLTETQFKKQLAQMQENEFWSNALVEYVDEYVDYVIEQYNEALAIDRGAALLLEQHLDFSRYVPEGFGRGDTVILYDGHVEIVDLKYGRNVPVRAENNPQLRLYALGAIEELSCLYDVATVTMTIVQPRNGGISTETISAAELAEWGNKIRVLAEKAWRGEGELVPGDYCRFCKAAPRCRAMQEVAMSVDTEKDVKELSDAEVAAVLEKADSIISWLHKVQDFALMQARDNGQKWPGYKLVEGRSVRKYNNEKEIAKLLFQQGYKREQVYKPDALIGVSDMQRLLGKNQFADLLGNYLIKPPGKPTLVPESDKRPEWNSPEFDFDDLG